MSFLAGRATSCNQIQCCHRPQRDAEVRCKWCNEANAAGVWDVHRTLHSLANRCISGLHMRFITCTRKMFLSLRVHFKIAGTTTATNKIIIITVKIIKQKLFAGFGVEWRVRAFAFPPIITIIILHVLFGLALTIRSNWNNTTKQFVHHGFAFRSLCFASFFYYYYFIFFRELFLLIDFLLCSGSLHTSLVGGSLGACKLHIIRLCFISFWLRCAAYSMMHHMRPTFTKQIELKWKLLLCADA